MVRQHQVGFEKKNLYIYIYRERERERESYVHVNKIDGMCIALGSDIYTDMTLHAFANLALHVCKDPYLLIMDDNIHNFIIWIIY